MDKENVIKCNSVGIQAGVDLGCSSGDGTTVEARKTIFLFGCEVELSGYGRTEEEAKCDLENVIRLTTESMWD